MAKDRLQKGTGRGVGMRLLIGVVIVLAFVPRAFADELDALLGPPPVESSWYTPPAAGANWRGVYFGGQVSYSSASADFGKSTQAPIAFALRETALEDQFAPSNWPVLGSASHGAAGFEGFAGFNFQYEKLVLGVEATYDQASVSVTAPNAPISRLLPADSQGDSYLVNITGSGSLTQLDFATLRGTAGWSVGNFLPYGFAGFALGHADLNIAATVSGQQNPASNGVCDPNAKPPCVPFSFATTAGKNSEWLYGFTVGGGLNYAVTQNIFLRAEYEFVQFSPVAGVQVDINSARIGAGFKF